MAVQFVPARMADAEILSEMRRRVWETTYRGIYPDDMIDNFDYAFHNERNRLFIGSERFDVYFLVEGTEKIGYLILCRGESLRLQSLYLLKEHRGRGLGTQAFAFARQYCRERGGAGFVLTCHPDNAGAMAFYEKMGGVIVSRDEGHARNEENGVDFQFAAG